MSAVTDIIDLLREAVGPHIVRKGYSRVQLDVNHHTPLTDEQIALLASHDYYLVEDRTVTCALRRLTFQVGGEPPMPRPEPQSWSATLKDSPMYACVLHTGYDLCVRCERRYSSILAMYGVSDQQARASGWGLTIRASLKKLCIMAQNQPKDAA